MLEKNKKGNIKKIKLNKPTKKQEEIEETLNYILDTLQTKVRRRTKF